MDEHEGLHVERTGRVVRVTIDHPPMNLLSRRLMRALNGLHRRLADDPGVAVVVVRSADPDFWIAHADLGDVGEVAAAAASGGAAAGAEPVDERSGVQKLMERWRTAPFVSIAQIEGAARGGGSELALSLDLRYAALDRARFAQPEAPLGIVAAAGGTQRLTRLLGPDRALEALLTGADVDARTAERLGWVTRALPDDEIGAFVDEVAARIAAVPPVARVATKRAVLAAVGDVTPGLVEEDRQYRRCLQELDSAAVEHLARGGGWQVREVEASPGGYEALLHGLRERP